MHFSIKALSLLVSSAAVAKAQFVVATLQAFPDPTCSESAGVIEVTNEVIGAVLPINLSQAVVLTSIDQGCTAVACFAGFSCFDQTVGVRVLSLDTCEIKDPSDNFNFDKLLIQCSS